MKPHRRTRRQWRHPEGWITPVWERFDGLRIHTGGLIGYPGQIASNPRAIDPAAWALACAIEGCADDYDGKGRRRAMMRFADLVYPTNATARTQEGT